ncbi:MAG: aspartate kinase [Cyclobacteriaceae bacterium]|nr:aspartate kinase [Cyclobacteriaceae bacterium]
MKVFKFGGAALRSAATIRNVASIIRQHQNTPLWVVVSAMGKTTNALERVVAAFLKHEDYHTEIQNIYTYHQQLIEELFTDTQTALAILDEHIRAIHSTLVCNKDEDEDEVYDQVVSMGEVLSSQLIHRFLMIEGFTVAWQDARNLIRTDSIFREGKVDWKITEMQIGKAKKETAASMVITQGFMGADEQHRTVTLGREGSDFSAAIIAAGLNAKSITIWKDVPGVMNADPKRLPAAVVFPELPYTEAAEMTYYGASVIHPKTIKPLALKNIPLWVKSFADPSLPGTVIHDCKVDGLLPVIVFKENQCLLSCKVTDFTFINEEQLSVIFQAISALNIKINVMQNSAISFSCCIDFRENKVMALIEKLQAQFEVYYNTNLTLITVKNYDEESFETYRKKPNVLLEQSSRSALQVLVKDL